MIDTFNSIEWIPGIKNNNVVKFLKPDKLSIPLNGFFVGNEVAEEMVMEMIPFNSIEWIQPYTVLIDL